MCGIAGVFDAGGRVDKDNLVRMRDRMAHRGPDDAGLYVNHDESVGLVHRRLSIIDLSSNGHQPMCNEDETVWITYNGEIYNFQELRPELIRRGHTFRSNTDSEVIVHAYEEWGAECVTRLRGMFAFAIWDENKKRLFLARDRLGIKPLYFAEKDGRIVFASELKGIKEDRETSLTIDESAVYDFFTYHYIPTPKTIYREVQKFPPAHTGIYENGRLTLSEYWDVEFGEEQPSSEEEAAESVLSAIQEAVELHLVSDVPVGVMLSGGLDSSTLTAVAAQSAAGLSHTFTIGFDVEQHDESRFASLVAEKYQTQHHVQEVSLEEARATQDAIIAMYDEPFADSSAIPTLAVCQLARSQVKVALSGEGGDELFAGYTRYTDWIRLAFADFLPQTMRKLLLGYPAKALPHGFKGKWSLQTAALGPLERYGEMLAANSWNDRSMFFSEDFLRQFRDYDDHWYFRKYWRTDLDPMSRMQYMDMKTYLHDDILTKMDRASMAVSLEARVPLLDHKLIENVAKYASGFRSKNNEKKYLLKKAVAQLLPHELLDRKKQGFSIPLGHWYDDPDELYVRPASQQFFKVNALESGDAVQLRNYWPLQVMNTWLLANS